MNTTVGLGRRGQVQVQRFEHLERNDEQRRPAVTPPPPPTPSIHPPQPAVVPERRRHVREEHTHASPEECDSQARDAFREEIVDEEAEREGDVGVV